MEAVPKSDIKSVIKSDIRFDTSIKRTTWIGHKGQARMNDRINSFGNTYCVLGRLKEQRIC